MLASLRTYRVISAFVALAMLFGVGLPLVHHVCGMSGETMAAGPVAVAPIPGEAGQHQSSCVHDHRDMHAEHCPEEAAPSSDGCEAPTCSLEAAEQPPAISADQQQPSKRLLLLPATLLHELLDPVPSSPSLQTYRDVAEAPVSSFVPLRLLTSTFLL